MSSAKPRVLEKVAMKEVIPPARQSFVQHLQASRSAAEAAIAEQGEQQGAPQLRQGL